MLRIVQFICLYILCAASAYLFLSTPHKIPIIWPATGVYLAALLVLPRAHWLALIIFITLFDLIVQNQVGGMPSSAVMLLPLISSGQALFSALLLQRFHSRVLSFNSLRDVMALLLWAAVLPTMAFGIPATLVASSNFGTPLFDGWIWWVAGNCLQVMSVTPVVLFLFKDGLSHIKSTRPAFWIETVTLLFTLVAATILSFAYGSLPGAPLPAYSFAPFALLMWSALRLGLRTTAFACVTFSIVAIWFDSRFIHTSEAEIRAGIIALEIFLLMVITSALVFAAIIEERARDNQHLAESQRNLRDLIELAPIGIHILDAQNYLYTNPAGARILSLEDPKDIIGLSSATFRVPEEKEEMKKRIQSFMGTEAVATPRRETTIEDASGKKRIIEAMATAIQWNGKPAILAMVLDITDKKQAEDALRRAQKMDALGQLTGGIAHDFNNILGIIIGNLELVQENPEDGAEVAQRTKQALSAVNRGVNITRRLLNFSRQHPTQTTVTSINQFVESIQELLAKSLTASIHIENHLAYDLWSVDVDPGELQDALVNLSLNARDAMPGGGSLIIETANKILDEDYVRLNPNARAGQFVMLSVSDTGTGIAPDVAERIFEPFFSTKGEGKGTGLGLSMVYGFAQRSGGHIKVYTEAGKGTTFRIYLPRAQRTEEAASNTPKESTTLPRGNETVLVVDDEADFIEIAAHNLKQLGYSVHTAGNAAEALKALDTYPDIDLLFSDVVMPGSKDGYALALEVHKANPNLKILLTSGFTQKREEFANGDGKFIRQLVSGLLSKPYNRSEMARAVRQCLDGSE